VNGSFFYKNAEECDRLVASEHCSDDNKNKSFVIINQKGIDSLSFNVLTKDEILALRRAKHRNMERLTLTYDDGAMNLLEYLTKEYLGFAEDSEEKFSFVEGYKNPKSVTILLKGSTKYLLNQLKDILYLSVVYVKHDLKRVGHYVLHLNPTTIALLAFCLGCIIPSDDAFEIVTHQVLTQYKKQVKDRARLGVQTFAESLLIIPKAITQNTGHNQCFQWKSKTKCTCTLW
ncbi:unnamed protein product, partial [Rotaria sordida]